MHKFLIICPINLENLVLKEMKVKKLMDKVHSFNKIKGGIEIECELGFGLELNKYLKTCTRILLRLKTQKCRDFPKLFQIISKFNFHPYLVQDKVEFKITTQESRIINTKKALETCEKAFQKYLKGQNLKENLRVHYLDAPIQKFYIRIFNDELTLSIDTTGELSHIRGQREKTGHAPLRETYASLILTAIYHEDYNQYKLLDPMCGTGTFLKEAKNYFKKNSRNYIYERWPLLNKLNFESIKSVTNQLFSGHIGLDRDKDVFDDSEIEFYQNELFENKFQTKEKLIIITNPPYGKRIKIKGDRVKFFNNLVQTIKEEFSPEAIYFIAPSEIPLKYNKILDFNNNGIKVNLYSIF